MRLLFLLLAFATALPAADGSRFTFAALGCMPYSESAWPGFERVIAEINRHHPAFTVHCGDTKDGGEPPSEAKLRRIYDAFNQFEGPLVYTPGDNEWTDVHRKSNGSNDPALWLARIRSLYFAEERSLGRHRMSLTTQRRDPAFAKFVENARWVVNGVVFATLHIVGSNNNDLPSVPGAVEEFREREAANISWMRATFAEAKAANAPGVAFFFQAAMFNQDYARSGRDSGYARFLDALEEQALFFGKPVLLVHSDEHRFRLDHGHRFDRNAAPVPNVIRLETFGDRDLHSVLVVVDPESSEVFLPAPLIVPENPLPTLPRSPYSR